MNMKIPQETFKATTEMSNEKKNNPLCRDNNGVKKKKRKRERKKERKRKKRRKQVYFSDWLP